MYIGNDLQVAESGNKIIDDISSSFNGSTTSFALTVGGYAPVPFPINTQQIYISVNGVIQEPDPTGSAGFKLLGTNIVFSSAPASGHAFFGVILSGADYVTVGTEFPAGSATSPSITFGTDNDTGLYSVTSGQMGFTSNGVQTFTLDGDAFRFNDDKKLLCGTGSDLEVFHDGSNSYIKDVGTGGLRICSSEFNVKNAANSEVIIRGTEDAGVELYFNNTERFATTNTGTNVIGIHVDDGATHDGDVTFTGANSNVTWDKSADDLIFNDNAKAAFGTGTDLEIYHDATDNQIKSTNGKVVITTTAGNSDIEITPNGSGNVKLDGLDWPNADGSANQYLKTDGSGALSWSTVTTTALTGSTNNALVTVTGANAIQEESALTFDGNDLQVRPSKANLIVAKSGLTVKTNSDLASTYDLIQIGAGGALASYNAAVATADTHFIHNAYRHSGNNWKYRYADSAARFRVNSPARTWIFESAASGSADGDITFVEQMRIDASGRLLLGTTTSRQNVVECQLQIEGTTQPGSSLSLTRNSNDVAPANLLFAKSRGTSTGSNTIVQSGDWLAYIAALGADGTDTDTESSSIRMLVDGTPGSNDLPGRIEFWTTPDGSATPAERMRIDSSGRLLLGVTKTIGSASYYDDITINNSGGGSGAAGGVGIHMIANAASWCGLLFGDPDDNAEGYIKYDNNTDAIKIGAGSSDRLLVNSEGMAFAADGSPATSGYGIRIAKSHASGGNVAQFYNSVANNYGGLIVHCGGNEEECRLISAYGGSFMTFYTESSGGAQNEWMRIKADGHVNFHTGGNSPGASQRGAQFEVNGTNTILQLSAGAVSSGNHIEFYNTNGQVGRIYSNNSATTYSTSSDYRLKENTVAISDGITRVKALKPYRFNWKSDSSKTKIDGFFAHEVSPVVPEAIGGVKDAVEPEDNEDKKIKKGDIIPQSIDQSKLVPLLTAALQEAISKIETLETKVAALESA